MAAETLIHTPRIFHLKQREDRWTQDTPVFRAFMLIGTLNIVSAQYVIFIITLLVIISFPIGLI